MDFHHSTTDDLPTQTQRDRDRLKLEKAMSEFFNRGGCVHEVQSNHRLSEQAFVINPEKAAQLLSGNGERLEARQDVSNIHLSRLLRAHCKVGATLADAARILNQPIERCEALAKHYLIPFRSSSFRSKKARS